MNLARRVKPRCNTLFGSSYFFLLGMLGHGRLLASHPCLSHPKGISNQILSIRRCVTQKTDLTSSATLKVFFENAERKLSLYFTLVPTHVCEEIKEKADWYKIRSSYLKTVEGYESSGLKGWKWFWVKLNVWYLLVLNLPAALMAVFSEFHWEPWYVQITELCMSSFLKGVCSYVRWQVLEKTWGFYQVARVNEFDLGEFWGFWLWDDLAMRSFTVWLARLFRLMPGLGCSKAIPLISYGRSLSSAKLILTGSDRRLALRSLPCGPE